MIADLLRAACLVVAGIALYNAAVFVLHRHRLAAGLSAFAAAAVLIAMRLMGVACG